MLFLGSEHEVKTVCLHPLTADWLDSSPEPDLELNSIVPAAQSSVGHYVQVPFRAMGEAGGGEVRSLIGYSWQIS